MLRLSRKLLFAIEAVVDIAYYSSSGPVQSGDISERQGIPRRYLEQVLQHLVKSGVLAGQRGPRGGYRLGRERRRITIGEIVRIVREIEAFPDPIEGDNGSLIGCQVVRPLWREMQEKMMAELDGVTIEDLCQRARDAGVQADLPTRLDFSI